MKNIIIIALLVATTNVFAQDLPQSWYTLPENQEYKSASSSKVNTDKTAKKLETLLNVHANVLSNVHSNQDAKFALRAFSLDLGLTHGGLLGILPFKGTAAMTAFWYPNSSAYAYGPTEMQDVELTSNLTTQDIADKAEELVRMVYSTGKVAKNAKLKREFQTMLEEFRDIARHLEQNPLPKWQVSRLYFDRSISASGTIHPPFKLGGEVRLRVGWKLNQKNSDGTTPPPDNVKNIYELAKIVSEELEQLSLIESKTGAKYALSRFLVGVGMSPSFDFGVVKAGVGAHGHLEFVSNEARPRDIKIETDDTIDLLVDKKDARKGFADYIAYKVKRSKLRKGLTFAHSIATWFAGRMHKLPQSDWAVKRFDARFDFGAGGLVLSALNTDASVTATYLKTEN